MLYKPASATELTLASSPGQPPVPISVHESSGTPGLDLGEAYVARLEHPLPRVWQILDAWPEQPSRLEVASLYRAGGSAVLGRHESMWRPILTRNTTPETKPSLLLTAAMW